MRSQTRPYPTKPSRVCRFFCPVSVCLYLFRTCRVLVPCWFFICPANAVFRPVFFVFLSSRVSCFSSLCFPVLVLRSFRVCHVFDPCCRHVRVPGFVPCLSHVYFPYLYRIHPVFVPWSTRPMFRMYSVFVPVRPAFVPCLSCIYLWLCLPYASVCGVGVGPLLTT